MFSDKKYVMTFVVLFIITIPIVFLIANSIKLENQLEKGKKTKSCLKKPSEVVEPPKKVTFNEFDIVREIPSNSEQYKQQVDIFNKYDADMNSF